jgi:uncharacterized membrane protein YoaK (UPF0700 family)
MTQRRSIRVVIRAALGGALGSIIGMVIYWLIPLHALWLFVIPIAFVALFVLYRRNSK